MVIKYLKHPLNFNYQYQTQLIHARSHQCCMIENGKRSVELSNCGVNVTNIPTAPSWRRKEYKKRMSGQGRGKAKAKTMQTLGGPLVVWDIN